MWFRVLVARYGVEGGRVKDGGQDMSVWWRDVATLRRGSGLMHMSVVQWGMVVILIFGQMFG